MTENSQIATKVVQSFKTGSFDEVPTLVQKGVNEGHEPDTILNSGMIPGIRAVGDQFRRGEVYLPEMMMAADGFQKGMDILRPLLTEGGSEQEATGTIIIGTVKGDIHALGKNIVITMLKVEGFSVVDLGADVPASKFADEAEKSSADIIGLSALMSTTMPQQREVIQHLEARGKRDNYYVMVGGGPTDANWCEKIGADAYGETAADAVSLALAYMKEYKGKVS